jgi:hypothetical protein
MMKLGECKGYWAFFPWFGPHISCCFLPADHFSLDYSVSWDNGTFFVGVCNLEMNFALLLRWGELCIVDTDHTRRH